MERQKDRLIPIEDWIPDNKFQMFIAQYYKCTHIYEVSETDSLHEVLEECVDKGLDVFIPISRGLIGKKVYGFYSLV